MENYEIYLRDARSYLKYIFCTLVMFAVAYFSVELKDESKPLEGSSIPSVRPVHYEEDTLSDVPTGERAGAKSARVSEATFQKKMARFDVLQGKVLMTGVETSEKEALLSELSTISALKSHLIDGATVHLVDRLRMIDFLEAALTWNDNPVRDEVLSAIDQVLTADNLSGLSETAKRSLIGDKVELFALLVQSEPSQARELFNSPLRKELKDILNYAVKRLSLIQKLEGDL